MNDEPDMSPVTPEATRLETMRTPSVRGRVWTLTSALKQVLVALVIPFVASAAVPTLRPVVTVLPAPTALFTNMEPSPLQMDNVSEDTVPAPLESTLFQPTPSITPSDAESIRQVQGGFVLFRF